LGFGEIALDFEHNTVPGAPEYERSQEPRAVAAYGKPEVVLDDGLYLSAIRWTPEGEKSARNFADLSPAIQLDDQRNVVFIHSAALTRNGAVDGLHFFSAEGRTEETKPMTIETADLAPLVGLSADATKEALLAELKKRLLPVTHDPITSFSVTVDGKEQKFGASEILALTSRLAAVESQLNAGAASAAEVEKGRVIASFAAEGKVPLDGDRKPMTAEALKAFSVDVLKAILANTPKTVSLSASARKVEGGKELKGISKAAAALNAQFA
jgi:phage I-like protein